MNSDEDQGYDTHYNNDYQESDTYYVDYPQQTGLFDDMS